VIKRDIETNTPMTLKTNDTKVQTQIYVARVP